MAVGAGPAPRLKRLLVGRDNAAALTDSCLTISGPLRIIVGFVRTGSAAAATSGPGRWAQRGPQYGASTTSSITADPGVAGEYIQRRMVSPAFAVKPKP
jgi:hypothetical protein